jgi:hypothetical protein
MLKDIFEFTAAFLMFIFMLAVVTMAVYDLIQLYQGKL